MARSIPNLRLIALYGLQSHGKAQLENRLFADYP